MVGENPEEDAKQVASKAANAPDDASGFEFQWGPVLLVGESRSADVDNRAYSAVALFLLEGGSEASRASVAMKADRSRSVNNHVPFGEDEDRWCGKFREEGANSILHGEGEFKRSGFF